MKLSRQTDRLHGIRRPRVASEVVDACKNEVHEEFNRKVGLRKMVVAEQVTT